MRRSIKDFNIKISNCSGAVLVEFAIIALIFYFLMAATVTFGQAIYTAQVLQDAARVGARELALISLPAETSFEDALDHATVRNQVFDPDCLVIDLDNDLGGLTLNQFYATLPPLNQALRGVMISETIGEQSFIRYPGAMFQTGTPGAVCTSGLQVAIPLVRGRNESGVETIDWVPVVEEIDEPINNPDPFLISNGGLVALRLNYPFQSTMMTGFQEGDDGAFEPNLENRIIADDPQVDDSQNLDGFDPTGTPFFSDHIITDDDGTVKLSQFATYSGEFGLGRQYAFGGDIVRPFRKFISAQAIFRREIFQ